jgi:hypothetical protein
MVARILLVGVVIQQNQRAPGGGEKRQPDERAKSAPIFLKISDHRKNKRQKSEAA